MKTGLLSLLILITSFLSAHGQLNTDRVLTVGRNALYFEDYVLSIQYFNQVIRTKPYMAQPYLLRALAKYNLDDFEGAIADATLAIERNPFLPDAWEVRGVSRQCIGDNRSAITDYAGALQLLPHNRHLLFNMAIAQSESSDYEAADSTFAELIRLYPRFDNAYVGRAQLHLTRGDTLAANADLTRALEINANSSQALVMRSVITAQTGGDLHDALADMDQAIRLQPARTPLRINRAVIRYRLDDINGALEDFSHVIESDPMNTTALYNRALLRAELNDNDRALDDLNRVLAITPDDHRALYNRAVILAEKRDTDAALADADAVIAAYPDLDAAYSLRAHIHQLAGHTAQARNDSRKAQALMAAYKPAEKTDSGDSYTPADNVTARFTALLTQSTDSDTEPDQQFNNSSIRGRVQDHRGDGIDLQPIYTLSYYVEGTTAENNGMLDRTVYVRDVADINDARTLRYAVYMTNALPAFTRDEEINRHFESIQRYGSILSAPSPRAIDYFGRAMDYVTIRNYAAAIEDLDKALAVTPDFAMAYFLRSVARYRQLEARKGTTDEVNESVNEQTINARNRIAVEMILSDLDRATEYSPRLAPAYFNRGTLLLQMHDYAGAIDAFNKAIEIDPTLAPAYFNRGYAHFSTGNRDAATADISRAGQLGIHTGYSLLKRMQRQ